MTNVMDAIWEKCKSLGVAGKRALKSRVCDNPKEG